MNCSDRLAAQGDRSAEASLGQSFEAPLRGVAGVVVVQYLWHSSSSFYSVDSMIEKGNHLAKLSRSG